MMAERDPAACGGELVAALQTAARQLDAPGEGDETATLSRIVAAAVETVPAAEQAGVSLLSPGGTITSAAISHDTVATVDQLQADYREGPCVTALWDEHTVTVEDLTAEHRWPRFAPQAAAHGVASMLSFHLFARDGTLGALNLYASRPRSFDTQAQLLGGLFATHAAWALGEARTVAHLQQALASRDVVGQAKGILMERFGVAAEAAFQMLVRSSQETNLKLVAVARWLTGADTQTASRPGPAAEDPPGPAHR